MKLRYIVTVCDYGVQGLFMKTVRQRRFRNLAAARRYETKFYNKAMRKPHSRGEICQWGSVTHNGNREAVVHKGREWNPSRTITITITMR